MPDDDARRLQLRGLSFGHERYRQLAHHLTGGIRGRERVGRERERNQELWIAGQTGPEARIHCHAADQGEAPAAQSQ